MTIEHTRIKTYSRAKGHSALAAAAYRGGFLLTDPRSDVKHDYRGRAGIIQACCLAPTGSPAWTNDPQRLWAAAEAAERRRNSTVCRDFTIALPHELDDRRRWDLVLDVSHALIKRYGFALQASHHRPTKNDPRYFYAHLLATTRRMEASGLAAKTRVLDGRINGKGEIEWIRAMISDRIHSHLARNQAETRAERSELSQRIAVRRDEGIFVKGLASFEQLLERYRKEGSLLAIPEEHTAEQARREKGVGAINAVASGIELAPSPLAGSLRDREISAGMDGEARSRAPVGTQDRRDTH
ncbi:plasmid mobilization protein [Stenotrophomonas lactitubi]|uniref:MobA/MobL family protein n=1 Tax=Stenotrophomonas TaxID=40323 RepID=UPI000C277AED|nr:MULTISPECIES: MobA/MobL family protein [Stenotrophomonas]MBA0250497.1 plasmid mobilization protein [Stenotrophomonas maltophilia]MBA0320009.1 plasmid mobilization protein [Stenotrophomonas maltophilia]PJO53377.1 plasmid mobilization protein [Stenotrophomonas lactitubi]